MGIISCVTIHCMELESLHSSVVAEYGSPGIFTTELTKTPYTGDASLPKSSSSESVKLDLSEITSSGSEEIKSPHHKKFQAFIKDVQTQSKKSDESDSPTELEQAANDLMRVYNLLRSAPQDRRKSLAGLMFALNGLEPTIAQQYLLLQLTNRRDIAENQSLVNLLGAIARCNSGQARVLLDQLFPGENPDTHELDKHKKEAESLSQRARTSSQASGSSVGGFIRSEWVKRRKTLLASLGLFIVGFGSNVTTYFLSQLNMNGSITQCNSDLSACQTALSACRFSGS